MTNHYLKKICNIGAKTAMIIAACAAFMPAQMMAVPAYRGPITHTQPDGTEITLYRSGDENHKELRDADGRLMYITDEGEALPMDSSILYRVQTEEGSEAGKKFIFSGSSFPSEGSPRALVILVEFADRSFSIPNPHEFYDRMLNEEGFSDYDATGSARDFFVDNSHGVFTPQFDVYGPIQLSNIMKYYGENNLYGDDKRPYEAVIEAVEALNDEIDYTQYDTDEDGQIDNVFIFYAGYGEADSNIYNAIWPHSADLDEFRLGKEYIYDGKKLNRYGMTCEIDYSYRRPDGIGTFVHEFSHVLGLPDLYSTTYSGTFTPGHYSALDYGPYNNQGRTPPNYSIFERYSLGWIRPASIDESCSCLLNPIHESNMGIIVPTDREDEFFLLENRQQEGWDTYIPGHGMLVWHIDFDQDQWDMNSVNNNKYHLYVDIEEADNHRSENTRAADTFPGTKGVTEFGPETSPAFVSWSGEPVGLALHNIEEAGDKIKFYAEKLTSNSVDTIGATTKDIVCSKAGIVSNNSTDVATIYGLSGGIICNILPGESRELLPGIYIIKTETQTLKVKI